MLGIEIKAWYGLLLGLLLLWGNSNAAHITSVDRPHIQVGLHSEVKDVQAGKPFWVALRLTPEAHWHTYWQNPGDSGSAPAVKWTLSQGSSAGEIQWPTPERIPVSHLVNIGYDGEVWLPVQITPPATLNTDTFTINADFSWLVCKEACIPGEATLSLALPITNQASQLDTRWQEQFAQTRTSFPQTLSTTAQLAHVSQQAEFVLTIPLPTDTTLNDNTAVWFLPIANDLIEHAAPQSWQAEKGNLTIQLKQSPYFSQLAESYSGVLLLGDKSYQVQANTTKNATTTTDLSTSSSSSIPQNFWLIALLALLGGVLLNLMPCVLPVLSLKALSLVQHGQEVKQQRLHGLAYTAGVVLSSLLVATVLLMLRAGGEQIGWGFQLQNPFFVALLVYLLFIMGLSLSGLVSFGQSWMGVGESLSRRASYSGSFFTGVLALLVASPCTAPFMGTALGYAVTQSLPVALTVFALLGLGIALPLLLLSFAPRLLRFLPKPGAWMETFKQLMAFPLYATALWLLWVLGRQVGVDGMTLALIGVLLLSLGLWLWSSGDAWWRKIALLITVLVALALLRLPMFSATSAINTRNVNTAQIQVYTPQTLQTLRAEQKPVFVNLTADWCITCLVNEQVALNRPEVQQAFTERGIVYLKGDWTHQDENITQLLAQFGRNGVPLYLFYPVGKEAYVLPQILTPTIVLEALE